MTNLPTGMIRVDTESAQIAVSVRGKGCPVLFVHGGPGAYDYLSDSVLGTWLAESHAVVGYDQRGCRRSTSHGPFTIDANVADMEAIRKHIGAEQLTVVGHSFGGLLALCYAAEHSGRIRSLVLIGSVGPKAGWAADFHSTLRQRYTSEQIKALSEIQVQIARQRDEDQRGELYRQRFNLALPSYLGQRHSGVQVEMEFFSRQVNVMTTADAQRSRYEDGTWLTRLAAVPAPVTVLHGRQDPMPWHVVEELQSLLPQVHAVGFEDCGHFPWLENPKIFAPEFVEAVG